MLPFFAPHVVAYISRLSSVTLYGSPEKTAFFSHWNTLVNMTTFNHSALWCCKQDCLELLNNLLRNNASNQVYDHFIILLLLHVSDNRYILYEFMAVMLIGKWYRYCSGRQWVLIHWYQFWSSEEAPINSHSRRLILFFLTAWHNPFCWQMLPWKC